jgi:hypothetical protein
MTQGWNFERRRDTCSQFLIGVLVLTKGLAEKETTLEAVRARMRLSPEEARFAARRLDEEQLIVFAPENDVRSNALGIARAEASLAALRAERNASEVARLLRAGGPPVALLASVLRLDGMTLPCGGPDPDATYRLALVRDVVTLEVRGADGTFTPA